MRSFLSPMGDWSGLAFEILELEVKGSSLGLTRLCLAVV